MLPCLGELLRINKMADLPEDMYSPPISPYSKYAFYL